MSTKKIIFLASFLVIVVLAVSAGVYYSASPKKQENTIQKAEISKETTIMRGYLRDTLQQQFYAAPDLQIRQKSVYPDDTSRYKSSTWTKNDADIYYQGFYSIKGKIYKESNLPLDYDVMVKKIIKKGLTDEEKSKLLIGIFKSNYFTNVNKFTINNEVKDTDVFGYNDDIAQDKSITKKYAVKQGSRITEYIWKNPDATYESRGIWIIDEDASNETVYFTACRIFPDSPLYSQKTCFQRN